MLVSRLTFPSDVVDYLQHNIQTTEPLIEYELGDRSWNCSARNGIFIFASYNGINWFVATMNKGGTGKCSPGGLTVGNTLKFPYVRIIPRQAMPYIYNSAGVNMGSLVGMLATDDAHTDAIVSETGTNIVLNEVDDYYLAFGRDV